MFRESEIRYLFSGINFSVINKRYVAASIHYIINVWRNGHKMSRGIFHTGRDGTVGIN